MAKSPAVANFDLSSVRGLDVMKDLESKFRKDQGVEIKIRRGWAVAE